MNYNMKDLDKYINEEQVVIEGNEVQELTVDDWRLIGAIIDDLRGDLKRNLEDIRKKEDLKTLYDKVAAVYKSMKNK